MLTPHPLLNLITTDDIVNKVLQNIELSEMSFTRFWIALFKYY